MIYKQGERRQMKSVLISIQPQWCELIASGKKTIEVRKSAPKEVPFKAYIYMTATKERCRFWEYITAYQNNKGDILNGSQKVIGEFICDKVYIRPANTLYYGKGKEDYLDLIKSACMTEMQVLDYMCGKFNRDTYFWHISDLKIYDKPKELGEFVKPCDWNYDCCTCKRAVYDITKAEAKLFYGCDREITRPPQSWCYVEEVEE